MHVIGNGPELGEVLQFADYRIRAAVEFVWCHRQSFQQRVSYSLVSRAAEAESRRHLPGHRQFATERRESDPKLLVAKCLQGKKLRQGDFAGQYIGSILVTTPGQKRLLLAQLKTSSVQAFNTSQRHGPSCLLT